MSQTIVDNFGRPINYVRLAVTDRCNLRCTYCMPAEGIQYLPKKQLLTYEEMERLLGILASLGISKVRITGGEPFLRKDLNMFLKKVNQIEGINTINITTNGVLTEPHIPLLKEIGCGVNLSLDTLSKERFKQITRRDELEKVLNTLDNLLDNKIPVKINMVVMDGINTDDIIPMINLAKEKSISVRFIEEMPFNGEGNLKSIAWNAGRILDHIKSAYPDCAKLPDPENSTASHYHIPGFTGNFGIIAAYSRTFCGSCNRIRLTAQGQLKTCLYDNGVLDLKQLMRNGSSDLELKEELIRAFSNRHKDGFAAEASRKPIQESMSTIGG